MLLKLGSMKRDVWGNYWRGIWVLELIENGGSTLAKNGTQNRDTDTHGGMSWIHRELAR